MKNVILFLFFIILVSCGRKTCNPFDLNHPSIGFHIFPDFKEEYIFENYENTDLFIRRRELSYSTDEKKVICGVLGFGCACLRDLNSSYNNNTHNINISNNITYDELGEFDTNITYEIGKYSATVTYHDGTILNLTSDNAIILTAHSSLNINKKVFKDVYELSIPDVSDTEENVQKIWIKPNEGMIGFQIYGVSWTKK